MTSNCNINQSSSNYFTIKRANVHKIQEQIGDIPTIDKHIVTLLVLVEGHNVIDFVVYDRRGSPANVFFIQTSQQPYSGKKKKYDNLKDRVKDGAVIVSNSKTIIEHYTDNVRPTITNVNVFYVYATTNLTGFGKYSNVFFLNLLEFCLYSSAKPTLSLSNSDSG